MMDDLPFIAEETGILQEWLTKNITTMFFKCTRWQVEETIDHLNCPFHYFCDSSYAGNFPPIIDLSVLAAMAVSFLSAAAFTALAFKSNGESFGRRNLKRRYFLPSGPIMLPVMLLILANGQRINTVFPLSQLGPSILLLIHVSALSFENKTDQRSIRYAVLEASTVSGILHASLYLDSIILPYYTGLDAISRSIFSGECPSCVCRKEDLVVGGRLVTYRGCSKTTLFIITALCSRMLSRISGEERFTMVIKLLLEVVGWVSVAADSVYLMIFIPHENPIHKVMIYGGICILILFNVFRKIYSLYGWFSLRRKMEGKKYQCLSGVEIL
ncbi:hypothetical protein MA16_Dca018010 [Dendrobium catenatum]|uniref:Uncharacterized protein n=2 Tax=Dendrobium catenatum TaxID=906689 RepID=A0A2I0WPC7_9ASPA|nr:hypothetical protein MA16_Dca018010 [Dendrobium catenatum]